ncbi:MAG: hypothetical protein WCJ84_03695 [Candidatus Peregrinibacteria bacterium]
MKTCRHCSTEFEVTEEDRAFYDKISAVFNGVKYAIPEPSTCPECRLQQRLYFRHRGKLYTRTCDATGKKIITMYSPEVPWKVYDQTAWWSDRWNPLDYGRDFNFSKPFFEQLESLCKAVPHISLINVNSENSYYCNHCLNQKNCYLVVGGTNCEDCSYGHFLLSCNNVLEGDALYSCQYSYEGVASVGCYQCLYFTNSRNCSDCFMISDCQNCQYCIGCFGLQQKKYYIFNAFVGEEKYKAFVKAHLTPISTKTIQSIREQFMSIALCAPHRCANITASETCTGDLVVNSKNCKNAFAVNTSENCKYISNSPNSFGSYDCSYTAPIGAQHCYFSVSTLSQNTLFGYMLWHCHDCLYSIECHNSGPLFGCVGLNQKKYCIFNKQYTKEQYEELVPKIIEHMKQTGEWGEFFPLALSPFGYNESAADDDFPMTREEVIEQNKKMDNSGVEPLHATALQIQKFNWSDYESPTPKVEKVITKEMMKNLPDDISKIPDDVLNWALTCEESGKLFIIQKPELEFYRKINLPLPHRHPDIRHADRMKLRNPRKLWKRTCGNCGTAMETTYSPDRPEKILCEKCYLDVVL